MMEVTSRVNVIVVVVVAVTAPFTRPSIDPILLDGVFSLTTPGGGNSDEASANVVVVVVDISEVVVTVMREYANT